MSVKEIIGVIEEIAEYATPVFRKIFDYGSDFVDWVEAQFIDDDPDRNTQHYSDYDADEETRRLREKLDSITIH